MALKLGTTTASLYLGSTPVSAFLGADEVYSAATSTALLLNFNGSNGSTTFTDSSPNGLTLTASGSAAISTAESKFGGASLSLAGGYLTSGGFDIESVGDGDWTLEAWVWRPTGIGNATILNLTNGGEGSINGLHLWVGSDNQVRWDEGTQECATGGSVPLEQWSHIAAARQNGLVTIYVDGVSVGSSSTPPLAGPYKAWVGAYSVSGGGFTSNMYIDDLRVLVGLALYTANFTPPTAQLGVI